MSLDFGSLLGLSEVGGKADKGQRAIRSLCVPVSIPLTILFRPQARVWMIREGTLRHGRETDAARVPIPVEPVPLDAWELRRDFLRLTTADEVLKFLNFTGVFHRPHESGYWRVQDIIGFRAVVAYLLATHPSRWRLNGRDPHNRKQLVFADQRIAEAIVNYASFKLRFVWASDTHAATITASATLEALLASVLVDHLRTAKFAFCERPDCRRQYEITSRHKRKYCSYDCAHLESVRRARVRKTASA